MTRRRPAGRLALLALALCFAFSPGFANESARADARGTPGSFDFLVLALSWSPTYCLSPKASRQQCGSGRHGFLVHGLWPQYERGWPQYCTTPAPFVPEEVLSGMADLTPSRGLILHEWRKHGTCSGLAPADFFTLARKARAAVAIPPQFATTPPASLTSAEIEAAFAAVNPGLQEGMMGVSCGDGRFEEIRICMTRDLAFRACPDVDRRGCAANRALSIPPPR